MRSFRQRALKCCGNIYGSRHALSIGPKRLCVQNKIWVPQVCADCTVGEAPLLMRSDGAVAGVVLYNHNDRRTVLLRSSELLRVH